MTDLTEQWKEGELPIGWYYVKTKDSIEIDGFDGKEFGFFSDMEIDQIFGEVPSYDEYMMTKDCVKTVFEAAQRETILKELLKECKEKLKYCTRETYELLTKIDEVLK